MLRPRPITPADRTDDVAAVVRATVGTAHPVVLPGAARGPAGDVAMRDIAREAADGLLGGLRKRAPTRPDRSPGRAPWSASPSP